MKINNIFYTVGTSEASELLIFKFCFKLKNEKKTSILNLFKLLTKISKIFKIYILKGKIQILTLLIF